MFFQPQPAQRLVHDPHRLPELPAAGRIVEQWRLTDHALVTAYQERHW
jgi:hypothetical protein